MLVAQGGTLGFAFLVLHGALAVRRQAISANRRASGRRLGSEIGFANVPRTADVIAIRDTSVLALTPAYQGLSRSPRHRRGAARRAGAAVRQRPRASRRSAPRRRRTRR
jgi:hypothetical protein